VDDSSDKDKAPDGGSDDSESAPKEASWTSPASESIREVTVARQSEKLDKEKDPASQGETLVEGDETCAPNEPPPSSRPDESEGKTDEFIAKDSPPAANGSSAPPEESVSAEPRKFRGGAAGSTDHSEATDDEDGGAFVIRHTFQAATRRPPGRSREGPAKSDRESSSGSRSGAGATTTHASVGLSAAAREAIARAQREAELLMIPRREHDVNGSAKKDRKEKKKKREKKRSGRGEDVDS
jgi:hypothetical protein